MCLEARHAPSRYVKAAEMLMKAKNNSSVSVFKYRTNQTYMMGWIDLLVVKLSMTTDVMLVKTE